jgi:hypothetical protein
MTLLNFDVCFTPQSRLIERTKKSCFAASGVTRRAAPAKRIALCFVNYPQVHSRCGKKLIAVAAGGSHRFSRTAPLTQSRNGPGKVATLPCGARGFAVLCEASRCRQSLAACRNRPFLIYFARSASVIVKGD